MATSLKRRVLFRVTVVLLAILCLEGVARLFPSDPRSEPVVPTELGRFDSVLGWSLKPGSQGVSRRTGAEIEYRINSKGLRDDETPYEKPAGVFRIVLLGDSRVFGFGVPIEKHFSTLLGGYFESVDAVNLGVCGFGVDQELLYLRSEGFRYEPDLVLAYVQHLADHRHMHTERWGKPKPRFVMIDGAPVLTNSPVAAGSAPDPGILRRVRGWLDRHCRTYRIVRDLLVGLAGYERDRPWTEQRTLDEENRKDPRFMAELNELAEALVFAMHEESAGHAAPFVLVTADERLHEASLRRGVLSLDVSGPLANDRFHLPDDLMHLNEAGNGVLAWEIAKFLRASGLVPAEHLPD